MRLVVLFCAVFFWQCADVLRADSYPPYPDQRVIDPTGKHYVVVERQGGPNFDFGWGPVKLAVAEARPGSDTVKSSKAVVEEKDGLYRMTGTGGVVVRQGDIVHGRVAIEHAPKRILVSSSGLGFVTLDYYGINYQVLQKGAAVTVFASNGRIRQSLTLAELLGPGALERYHNGCGSVWWLGSAWIDETDRDLIIVASAQKRIKEDRPIVLVNLDNGKVRRGGRNNVLRAIAKMTPGGVERALDIAIELKIEVPKSHLTTILNKEQFALATRLRAAVLLANLGHQEGAKLFRETSLAIRKVQIDAESHEYDEGLSAAFSYLIAHLPAVLKEDGLPVLKAVAKKYGYGIGISQAFSEYGDKAVSTLVSMLEDQRDPEVQYLAAEALGEIGPAAKTAVPSLVKALTVQKKTTRGQRIDVVAAYALGQIGHEARDAMDALMQLATDPDKDVRGHAVEALERIRGVRKNDDQ